MLSEQYIAGVIDSEGCIFVEKETAKNNYRLELTIGMSDLPAVERLYRYFGLGRLYARNKQNDHHKQIWVWKVRGNQAKQVLEMIAPHMITKKEEAYVAISFQEAKEQKLGNDVYHMYYTKLRAMKQIEYRKEVFA